MKKDTLIEIILATVGGLIFSVGMCMALLRELNMLIPGIIASAVGAVILLSIIPVYRKSHPKKEKKLKITTLTVAIVTEVLGALVMGFGMSRVLTGGTTGTDAILGIAVGVVGLIICTLTFPVYSYIKGNEKR